MNRQLPEGLTDCGPMKELADLATDGPEQAARWLALIIADDGAVGRGRGMIDALEEIDADAPWSAGIESLCIDQCSPDIAQHLNAGDTYARTLIRLANGVIGVGCWGDVAEAMEAARSMNEDGECNDSDSLDYLNGFRTHFSDQLPDDMNDRLWQWYVLEMADDLPQTIGPDGKRRQIVTYEDRQTGQPRIGGQCSCCGAGPSEPSEWWKCPGMVGDPYQLEWFLIFRAGLYDSDGVFYSQLCEGCFDDIEEQIRTRPRTVKDDIADELRDLLEDDIDGLQSAGEDWAQLGILGD